jgi:hypothetical protein
MFNPDTMDWRTADVLSILLGLGSIAALVVTMVICAVAWAAQSYHRCWWCLALGLVPPAVMLSAPLVWLGVDGLWKLFGLLGGFGDIRTIFLLGMAGLLLTALCIQLVAIPRHYLKLWRRQKVAPERGQEQKG